MTFEFHPEAREESATLFIGMKIAACSPQRGFWKPSVLQFSPF